MKYGAHRFIRLIPFFQPIPKNSTLSFVGVEAPDSHDFTFFNAPITSFFKTFGMSVGEIEYGDLPIDASSSLSIATFSFLTVFIFAIMVVQMNLLNGLAVSDVRELQKTAEIWSVQAKLDSSNISSHCQAYFRIKTIFAVEERMDNRLVGTLTNSLL